MINIFKAIRTRKKVIDKISNLEFSIDYLESDHALYSDDEYLKINFGLTSKIELLKSLL